MHSTHDRVRFVYYEISSIFLINVCLFDFWSSKSISLVHWQLFIDLTMFNSFRKAGGTRVENSTTKQSNIIVALDGLGLDSAAALVSQLKGKPYAYKIHDLWDQQGPGVVRKLLGNGAPRIFVDLKLHDIPNTVALRARAVRNAGATMLTVHASGGTEMMRAAVENGPPEIYAVTVLTSLSDGDAHKMYGQPAAAAALRMARLTQCVRGIAGIVCSPQEVGLLATRQDLDGMKFITPGIRPAGKEAADQRRVDTPESAIYAGAHFLVIGRPITQAPNPVAAFDIINAEMLHAIEELKSMRLD